MYAIYGNIYHQYTPNVSIYTSTMDPMGYKPTTSFVLLGFFPTSRAGSAPFQCLFTNPQLRGHGIMVYS